MILLLNPSFSKSVMKDFTTRLESKKLFERADIKILESGNINYTPFPEGESPEILGVGWSNPREIEGILEKNPSIKWIHSFSAGIDAYNTEKILGNEAVITNAKGAFSWDLAEFVSFAMLWYVKRGQKWLDDKKERKYDQGYVERLRDKTLGKFNLFYF